MIRTPRARTILIRLAGAAAVAAALSQFPWSRAGVMPFPPRGATRQGADPAAARGAAVEVADLAALLPADPLAILEARALGTALADLPTGELRQRLFATPSWKQFQKSPEHAQLLAGATFVELTAGMPLGQLLATLFGEQLVAAIVLPTAGATMPELMVAVRAADADHAEQVVQLARAAVAMNQDAPDAGRIEQVGSEEAVVLRGKLWLGAVGRDLLAASSAARFAQLTARARSGTPASATPAMLTSLRASAPQDALILAAADLVRLGSLQPGGLALPEKQADAGGALLVGDLIAAVRRSDVARLAITRRGDALAFDLALPHDPNEPLPEHFRCFAHANAAEPLPLLRPREALVSWTMRRDWASFWADHGELCDPASEPSFVEAKTNFGVFFGGRSLPDELLPALDQPFLFVLTRREWGGQAPAVRYPVGAMVWRARPGQAAIGADFESALLGAISLGNFAAIEEQKRTPPYRLSIGEHRGVRIVAGAVAAERFAEADLIHQNLEPCFAQVGDWLILASSQPLLRELIEELQAWLADPSRAVVAPSGSLTYAEVLGGPTSRLAEEDRAVLIQNAVLNEGKEPAAAEFETGVLIDALRELERARLSTRIDRDAFHLEIELRLVPFAAGGAAKTGAATRPPAGGP